MAEVTEEVKIPCVLNILKIKKITEGHYYMAHLYYNEDKAVVPACPNDAELEILFNFAKNTKQ